MNKEVKAGKTIEVIGIEKSFKSRDGILKVLDGITFKVDAASLVCILGPSGSGKSVTLHIISGLLQKDKGKIMIGNEEVRKVKPGLFSFVFQNPRLLPWLTVEGNIKYILRYTGKTNKEMNEIIDKVLDTMHLLPFKKYYPHQLSGGMQQRVALARAWAFNSDIILMDEPFSSLDEITAIALREELLRIWERERKTIIFVTHNIAEACYLADKIVLLTPKPTKVFKEVLVPLERPRVFGEDRSYEVVKKVFKLFEECLSSYKVTREDLMQEEEIR